jgi:NADPH-dependent curcumin reductase CurA
VLIAARYISVDPYMRIEQSKLDTWEAPHPLGAVQGSAVVGQVVQSNADELAVGDWTLSSSGWQNRMVRIVRSRTRDDAAMFATAPAR